jgi:hypothetical protein
MHPAPSGVPSATSPIASTYADALAALDAARAAAHREAQGASARALRCVGLFSDDRDLPAEPKPAGEGEAERLRYEAERDLYRAARIARAERAVGDARAHAAHLAEREDAEEAGRRILGESGIAGPREAEVHANGRGEGADVWLSLYRVDLRDGGPEEGGWHWTRRELVAAVKRSGFLRAEDDPLTSAADADARAALAAVAEAHGLTLDGHFIARPDGTLRPARGYRSAAPEVDAQILAERVIGENVNTSAPRYE